MHPSRRRRSSALVAVLLLVAVGVWFIWRGGGPERGGGRPIPAPASDASHLDGGASGTGARHPSEREEIPGAPQQTAPDVTRNGSLRIELTFADESPGSDLVVSVCPKGVGRHAPSSRRSAHRSDSSGVVEKSGLSPGDYLVSVAHPIRLHEGVRIEAGTQALMRIQFRKGFTIRGEVVNRRGQPVPGAEIWSAVGGLLGLGAAPIAISDEFGRFVLRDKGPFGAIGATAAGYAPSPETRVGGEVGTEVAVRLVLQGPGGGARGLVVDAGGTPVVGATVSFPNEDLPWSFRGELKIASGTRVHTVTDDDGRFEVSGLPPLSIAVMAGAEGHGSVREKVEITAGESTEILLRLRRASGVHGRVLSSEGVPIEGVRIHASSEVMGVMADAGTNSQGFYRLSGLTPGQINLQVIHDRESWDEEITLREGEDRQHDIREASSQSLRGRVLDHEDQPLVGWSVLAVSPRRDMASAKTDAEGRFILEKVKPEQTYRFTFCRTDTGRDPPAHTVFGVRAGEEEAVFRLPSSAFATASIRGRVLDWKGRPLEKARVRCTHALSWVSATVEREPGGRFAVNGLPPGRYEVLVVLQKQVRFLPEVRLKAGVDLDLGDIRGGQPATLSVELEVPGGSRPDSATIFDAHKNRIAEFPLTGTELEDYPIAAGVYFVQFHAASLSSRTHRVPITGGEHNVVRLRLGTAVSQTMKFSFDGSNTYLAQSLLLVVRDAKDDPFLSERIPFDMAVGASVTRSFPVGRYRVSASCSGGASAQGEFEVTAASAPEREIVLQLR